VAPNWSGIITPSRGIWRFIPALRSYSNVTNALTSQNFTMTTASSLAISSQVSGQNIVFGFYGIQGVTYQTLYSTDMVNWFPFGSPIAGSNAVITLSAPLSGAPAEFFKFTAY